MFPESAHIVEYPFLAPGRDIQSSSKGSFHTRKGCGYAKEETLERRYGKRAKEVAARTVMKHHKEEEHKKGE
ncbi:MAG: hypothetical protein NVS3B14_04070 [Ktedonobacteraceae bacterium]